MKTNVHRLLDANKIEYKEYEYKNEFENGLQIANALNVNPNQMFKTLVTIGASKQHYVFMVPVNKELDLKKAAKAVKEKSIEMVKSKELLNLTGYIHGGCSPIGMKKFFKTTVDISIIEYETIIFSAGRIGHQAEIKVEDLSKMIEFEFEDLTK